MSIPMVLKCPAHNVAETDWSSKLFLCGRAAPDSIETDVETITLLIVDSTKGFAGNVVLQIKYASGRFGWVEDMEKRPHGKGVATYSSVVCDRLEPSSSSFRSPRRAKRLEWRRER